MHFGKIKQERNLTVSKGISTGPVLLGSFLIITVSLYLDESSVDPFFVPARAWIFQTGARYRPSVNLAVLATHRRNRGSDLVFCTALLSTRNLSLCRTHLVIQTNNWSFSFKKTGFRRVGVFGEFFFTINIVGLSVHEDFKLI